MKWVCSFLLCASLAQAAPPNSALASVQRVFVESLGSNPEAVMLRDMVIASLASSPFVSVTENLEKSDAILRGSADDQVYTEQHQLADSITAGIHSGSSDSYSSKYDRTSSSKNGGLSIGQHESMQQTDRRHEASASVRLVNKNGDVIWSTTQESLGAKFRSSSADVADKIARKLQIDIQLSRSSASAAMHAGMPTR